MHLSALLFECPSYLQYEKVVKGRKVFESNDYLLFAFISRVMLMTRMMLWAEWCCDSRYVGRTSQRLQDSIKQHVPKWLRRHTASQRVQTKQASRRRQPAPECDSATGRHLSENDQRAVNYNNDQYSILDSARSPFHLSLLEASYIRVWRSNLHKQKELAHTLKLFK